MKENQTSRTSPQYIREANRAVVRVWTSGLNHRVPGHDVGHVSIETKDGYISLWPAEPVSFKGPGIFTPIKHQFHTYGDDLRDEKRRPERTICLYSLYISRITSEFEKLVNEIKAVRSEEEVEKETKQSLKGWRLIGSNLISRIDNSGGESCASLAYRLLNAGGIGELISSKYSSKQSIIVTPDDLLLAVEDARKEELQRFNNVQGFNYKNPTDSLEQEWIPESLDGRHKPNCLIL